jgi:L-ascorbate metabolism protein UlaG (beta-lactamase superfamily)
MSQELLEKYTSNINWYLNAGIAIEGSKTVYFDPYGFPQNAKKADYIFISHPHRDNFPGKIIKELGDENSVIFITRDAYAFEFSGDVVNVCPNETYEGYEGISLKTVPSYTSVEKYHPQKNNWVGYILKMDDITYYFAGDTDLTPEMSSLGKIDVAFLPIGGVYTMDSNDALKAVDVICPKVVIPVHFGMIVGTFDEAEEFVKRCPVPSKILKVTR